MSASVEHRVATLAERLQSVRSASERLIAGLEPEDLGLQGMADASPPKWHLAHTTWFFEEFLLRRADAAQLVPGHIGAEPGWSYLFNSYYDAVGPRHPRPQRGLLSRPAIGEILAWRRRVDRSLAALLAHPQLASAEPPGGDGALTLPELIELGLQHEQQHQELLLMDLLDGFSR
ncbi:MAG: hypothetical protein RLZZ624_859, partial [Cyanobacteriota bacterium]